MFRGESPQPWVCDCVMAARILVHQIWCPGAISISRGKGWGGSLNPKVTNQDR